MKDNYIELCFRFVFLLKTGQTEICMNALKTSVFALPLLLATVLSTPVRAEEEKEEPAATAEQKAEAKEPWEVYPHFFTGFGGVTIGHPEGLNGEEMPLQAAATFGIDYSFRVSKYFGVGAYFDYATQFRELLVGPCLFFFPWKGLFLEASPSLEIARNEELSFAARLAVGYEFEVTDQLLLGLYAAVDYGHARFAFVPGVTVGWGF